ncbi:MAG: molybdenum cofactor biosynthesis protein MoaE [Myxococcota bacterium]
MKIGVRLFGALREEVGAARLDLELPDGACAGDVRQVLAERLPSLAQWGDRLRISVNLEFTSEGQVLRSGDEVALLPPVAGGSAGPTGLCTLSEAPLVERDVVARVAGDDAGGVVTFVGTVRNRARGHEIKHLEYEAYPEMAEREMEKIAVEAAERWPGVRVAMAHRVGRLEIGDAAVIIAACAPHRGEAFEACRFCIDTLKQTVPIWKKEVAVDGAYWVDDHA